jgi:transcription initiation factor TFIID subunit 7
MLQDGSSSVPLSPTKTFTPAASTRPKRRRLTANASSILDDMTPMALFQAAAEHEDHEASTSSKDYRGFFEEQLVLRLPPGLKEKVRESIQGATLSQDFSIQFYDERHGFAYFQGEQFKATLVDLPTLTESYKTLDKKQFYKIADICQMVYVSPIQGERDSDASPCRSNNPGYPHGLTAPLMYVRKRRFRKLATKHQHGNSAEDVERIVAKLIEADMKAMSVSVELVRHEHLASQAADEFAMCHPSEAPQDLEEGAEVAGEGAHDLEADADGLFGGRRGYAMDNAQDSDDSDLAAEIEFSLLE